MVGSPRGTSGLQSLSISRLREVARSLRVHLFSRLSRADLIRAIARRSTGAVTPPADLEAMAAPESMAAPEPQPIRVSEPLPAPDSWLQLEAIDSPWVQLRWQLSPADGERLRSGGASRLCLRLADITDRDDRTVPQTQLEAVPEGGVNQWQLVVPLLGRLYRAELGFRRADDGHWIALAASAPLWLAEAAEGPSAPPPAAADSPQAFPVGTWIPSGVPAIHERAYQAATALLGRRRRSGASEELQEHGLDQAAGVAAGPGGLSDSAAGLWPSGLWESGRHESGSGGVPNRVRSFWLVADAELIVYGATDPAASLSIGEESVALSAEGTFQRRVPFADGEQLWPIAAVAADGEQRRSITLSFERRTPRARVNTAAEAQPEWF
jgi:hypothetical protein